MKTLIHLISILLLGNSQGNPQLNNYTNKSPRINWCSQPLQQSDLAKDHSGNLYTLDQGQLRKFETPSLLKYYKLTPTPPCLLPLPSFLNYPKGAAIYFRPDQDLHEPRLLQSPPNPQIYLWLSGKLHILKIPTESLQLPDNRIFTISRLELNSLPHSQKPLKSLQHFHRLRPKSPPPSQNFPNNTLLRGSHPKRIYLYRNSHRYYLWSRQAFSTRGLLHKEVKIIPDRLLYQIPFAGYLF